MKHLMLALLLPAALFSAAPVDAGNAERGREKSAICQACHGVDGNGIGMDMYPILAGQFPDYLAHAMRAYKTGEREDVVMRGFAAPLSEQDIKDLAAWYGSQKGPLADLSHFK
ncbi:MAG: cytochrome c [Xanthomonadales bacterium]|nr:cytochrome c [Xanthomonadales bacterium]